MTHRDDDPEGPSPAAAAALEQGHDPMHEHVHDHMHDHVDCRRLAQMLGDYVDELLPTGVKDQVDAHMSQCAPCMAFLKQYRFAPEAARRVLLKAVPPELESRVLSFLRERCKKG
jgi:hypothetical protein